VSDAAAKVDWRGVVPGLRTLSAVIAASASLLSSACADAMSPSPTPPTGNTTTANVYALPGAVDLGPIAFGDEPIVIFRGEWMRFRNADATEHNVVADTQAIPEFMTTGTLPPGGEKTFMMNTVGKTTIHCTIHPQMTGTLIVRER
jgi:plastocyanin